MGVRIQELPETTGINKEDVLIVEDGQGTKKGTVQQLDEALGVSQLKEDLSELSDLPVTWTEGAFISNITGQVTENTAYKCTDFIPIVRDGMLVSLVIKTNIFKNTAIAIYDENKTYIRNAGTDSETLIDFTTIVTGNNKEYFVRVSSHKDYAPVIRCSARGIGLRNEILYQHDKRTNLIAIDKCTLGYVNGATDGSINVSTSMYVTPYIPLEDSKQYYYNLNYLYRGYCAFYDADKNYINGFGVPNEATYLTSPFTPPTGTAYGRFTIAKQVHLTNTWLCETNQMAEKPAKYAEKIVTDFVEEKPTDYTGNEISVFNKILCVGDSLTDGFFNENGGSRLIIRNRAYPAKLQALTGIECTNMGHAGYTSKQWYDAYKNTDVSGHDCCIIQLGVNDALKSSSTAETTQALTDIITKVKSENGGIKIFVATIIPANGYMLESMRVMSETIRTIVNNLNDANVYLVDLWEYGHTADLLAFDSGHLSAYGYYQLACDYKAYISYIIKNNPNDFRYVQFIGTSYSLNGDNNTRNITY